MARAVVLPLNTWRTIVKDKNTRHAFDEMFVSIEAVINDLQKQIDALENAGPDVAEHTLLQSDVHTDTVTDAPSPGSLIKGEPGVETDFTPYWLDGLPIPILPTETDTTGVKYWVDGLPFFSLSDITGGDGTKWVEHLIGPSGAFLRSTGTDLEWAELSSVAEVVKTIKNLQYSVLTDAVTAPNGASWGPTGLSVTLPMTSDTSRAVLQVSIQGMSGTGADVGELRITRNGTEVQTIYSGEFTRQTCTYWHVETPGIGDQVYAVEVRQMGSGANVLTIGMAGSGLVVSPCTLVGFEVL